MGNPFKRKKFRRAVGSVKEDVKRIGRNTAGLRVKVTRGLTVAGSFVTGVFMPALTPVVIAAGAYGNRYNAATDARKEGKRGRDARVEGREEFKRTGTYGLIAGGAGVLTGLVVSAASASAAASAANAAAVSPAVAPAAGAVPTSLPGGLLPSTLVAKQAGDIGLGISSTIVGGANLNPVVAAQGATLLASKSAPLMALGTGSSTSIWGTLAGLGKDAAGLATGTAGQKVLDYLMGGKIKPPSETGTPSFTQNTVTETQGGAPGASDAGFDVAPGSMMDMFKTPLGLVVGATGAGLGAVLLYKALKRKAA